MITIIEVWHLKPEFEDDALELMQQMDDLVGPPAHVHPGWCGHASFYQSAECPTDVLMMYPWRSRELHEALRKDEEQLLRDFFDKYCTAERDIHYYHELPVEVEHQESHADE